MGAMHSTLPFQSRLRTDIAELRRLQFDEAHVNTVLPQWVAGWAALSDDQLVEMISEFTMPAAQEVFCAAEPPSLETLLALPEIRGDTRAGVYLGIVTEPREPGKVWLYVGSGTSTTDGLTGRINFHLDGRYREGLRKRKRSLFLYNILDEAGKDRTITFRKLAGKMYESGEGAHVLAVRVACLVAEALFTGWLGSYKPPPKGEDQLHAWKRIILWAEAPFKGTNSRPCVLQPINWPDMEKPAALSPIEANRRAQAILKAKFAAESEEVQAVRRHCFSMRNREIYVPARRMKSEGASDAEIKAFRKEANRRLNLIAPWPGSKRSRDEEDEADEPVRKKTATASRRSNLAPSPSPSPSPSGALLMTAGHSRRRY